MKNKRFISITPHKCLPRREQYQGKKIITSTKLTPEEIQYVKNEFKKIQDQNEIEHSLFMMQKYCKDCGGKHLPGIMCQNPMDNKFLIMAE